MTRSEIYGFQVRELAIQGAWLITSSMHSDRRGYFQEWFRRDLAEQLLEEEFQPEQANRSVSTRGVIRGIHFSRIGYRQHKWITATQGRILDVIVDLRPNSATFGFYDSLILEEGTGQSVLISAGLGHGFEVMSEVAEVSYLLSEVYEPSYELRLNPLDAHLSLPWNTLAPVLSDADTHAPTFETIRNSLHN